jgi:hypothetical protein
MSCAEKCQLVHLYNINESPLWNLKSRLLTEEEEFLPDEYFAYLGHMAGVEVIVMGQMDESSGIISFDLEGQFGHSGSTSSSSGNGFGKISSICDGGE